MPNHASTKKSLRKTARRALINTANRSRVRTFIRKVESAIQKGDAEAARAAFISSQPEIHRGVAKGVLHRNTAARKLSRLSARIKGLSAQA